MSKSLGAKVMVLLSMIYGLTLAVIAGLDLGDVGPVAMIGAGVLAVLWVALGMFGKSDDTRDDSKS